MFDHVSGRTFNRSPQPRSSSVRLIGSTEVSLDIYDSNISTGFSVIAPLMFFFITAYFGSFDRFEFIF